MARCFKDVNRLSTKGERDAFGQFDIDSVDAALFFCWRGQLCTVQAFEFRIARDMIAVVMRVENNVGP